MSDVEERIAQWHAELARSQAIAAPDIEELSSHLREEIGRLQATGLSEVEAFLVARHRLGDVAGLAQEFRKVNGDWRPTERLSWMALGALVYLLVGYAAGGLAQGGIVAAAHLGVRGYSLGLLGVTLKAIVASGLLVAVWMLYQRWVRVRSETRSPLSRRQLGLLCAALVIASLTLIAGQLLSRLAAVQTLSIDEFSRTSIVSAYAGLIWTFFAPILAGVLVIVFHQHALRRREACIADPSAG